MFTKIARSLSFFALLGCVVIPETSFATQKEIKSEKEGESDPLKTETLKLLTNIKTGILKVKQAIGTLNDSYKEMAKIETTLNDLKKLDKKAQKEKEDTISKVQEKLKLAKLGIQKDQEIIKADLFLIGKDAAKLTLNMEYLKLSDKDFKLMLKNSILSDKERKKLLTEAKTTLGEIETERKKLIKAFFDCVESLLEEKCLTQAFLSMTLSQLINKSMKEEWQPFNEIAEKLDDISEALGKRRTVVTKLKKDQTTLSCKKK